MSIESVALAAIAVSLAVATLVLCDAALRSARPRYARTTSSLLRSEAASASLLHVGPDGYRTSMDVPHVDGGSTAPDRPGSGVAGRPHAERARRRGGFSAVKAPAG
jgi:hypothetical protein